MSSLTQKGVSLPASVLRRFVCLNHGVVGMAAVLVGGAQLFFAGSGSPQDLVGAHAQPMWVRICLGAVVFLPGVLVFFSAWPMWTEDRRAFRSAAVAGFVLGVGLIGPWLLFGGELALCLGLALAADFALLGTFALVREWVRARS